MDRTFQFDDDQDIDPDSTPTFTHVEKSEKYFFYFYCTLFYLSHQRHRCHSFQYLGQYRYWTFCGKKYSLSLILVEIDMDPNQQAPDLDLDLVRPNYADQRGSRSTTLNL
jgi:hypothetical protein